MIQYQWLAIIHKYTNIKYSISMYLQYHSQTKYRVSRKDCVIPNPCNPSLAYISIQETSKVLNAVTFIGWPFCLEDQEARCWRGMGCKIQKILENKRNFSWIPCTTIQYAVSVAGGLLVTYICIHIYNIPQSSMQYTWLAYKYVQYIPHFSMQYI